GVGGHAGHGGGGIRPGAAADRRPGRPRRARPGLSATASRAPEATIAASSRALVLGIGGGGDVVGALALARLCEQLGTEFVLGGVSWERYAIDPHPGPRPIAELRDVESLAPAVALAGPATSTPGGLRLSEARLAAHLGRPTVLVDINPGPDVAADSIVAAARALDCDLAIYVDVGGDVLAHGDERGLSSPLCDAVLLAAAARAADELPGL